MWRQIKFFFLKLTRQHIAITIANHDYPLSADNDFRGRASDDADGAHGNRHACNHGTGPGHLTALIKQHEQQRAGGKRDRRIVDGERNLCGCTTKLFI